MVVIGISVQEMSNKRTSVEVVYLRRWAGHVARTGEKRNAYRLLAGKQKERDHKEDQDVGGWIILGWILEKWDVVMWTRLVWLWIGTGGELL
jgi:hypothetical protein